MWIKICGITHPEDAAAAARGGADAIGLNFVSGPRLITIQQAKEILTAVPPFVIPVALLTLINERPDNDLYRWLVGSRIRHLQLYNPTSPAALEQLAQEGFSVFPVIRVQGPQLCDGPTDEMVRASSAVILDAYDPAQLGGTGKSFSWDWVAQAREAGRCDLWPPIILAGGLRPDNVAAAIQAAQPDGVDVSSGVEFDAQVGRKDPLKMAQFIAAARAASE